MELLKGILKIRTTPGHIIRQAMLLTCASSMFCDDWPVTRVARVIGAAMPARRLPKDRAAPVIAANVLGHVLAFLMALVAVPEAAAQYLPADVAAATSLDEPVIGGIIESPSPVYAAFQRFAKTAPREQVVRLLNHQNRVVRAYAAQYLARYLPSHAAAFYPLLSDQNQIWVRIASCEDEHKIFILADFAIQALCKVGNVPAGARILQRASVDPALSEKVRVRALECHDYYKDNRSGAEVVKELFSK